MRLKNLSEAVERFLDTQRPAIQEAALTSIQPIDNQAATTVTTLTETDLPQSTTEQPVLSQIQAKPIPTEKRYAVYQRTKELQREGHGIRAVARHLGRLAIPSSSIFDKISSYLAPSQNDQIC